MRLSFRELLMNMGAENQRFNSIKDAISHGDWGYDWAKHFLDKQQISQLFQNIHGEIISPFEAACYYGNNRILTHILNKAQTHLPPKEQINKAFSHAIWRGHPDILVTLLNAYGYTFDEAEFTQVKMLAKQNSELASKIHELNQQDLTFAKNLALLFPDLQAYGDITKYLCRFLPVLNENRSTEILHALRSFERQNRDENHTARLQSFQEVNTLRKSVEQLTLQEGLNNPSCEDTPGMEPFRAKL